MQVFPWPWLRHFAVCSRGLGLLLCSELMGNQAEFHQLMLERMQQLEEALCRAIAGVATTDDWAMIRFECGLPAASIFKSFRSEK